MKIKMLNQGLGATIKFLYKFYTREDNPMAVATNIGTVLHNFPKEGGMEAWIPGHDFPFPGLPDDRIVETMNIIKRIFPIVYKWGWVVLRDRLPQYLIPQSQNGDIGIVDPKKYSKPVRELHKSHTFIRSREGEPEMKAKWTEKRDVECLFYEYDDQYRFREMLRIITMDWSQFLFTPADKYWASMKWKYDWGDFGESKFKENIDRIYHQLQNENIK
jgi:hypothetical protein